MLCFKNNFILELKHVFRIILQTEGKRGKRRESDEVSVSSRKRSSLEEGRQLKTKRVGFIGVQWKEAIEKQLAEIQKELLTLQMLPIEIQNHLLIVQQSLQDILAQQSQMQVGC